MKAEKKEEVILFMDGVHPNHQTQNVYGWIERSNLAQVASTGSRQEFIIWVHSGNS